MGGGREQARGILGSVVTLIRCAARTRCKSSHKRIARGWDGRYRNGRAERADSRGEARPHVEGSFKRTFVRRAEKRKGKRVWGEQRRVARVFQGLLTLLRSYFASTNHGGASSFGSMPEARRTCVINAPCPCTQNATLSFAASPTARDCTPVPPSDLARADDKVGHSRGVDLRLGPNNWIAGHIPARMASRASPVQQCATPSGTVRRRRPSRVMPAVGTRSGFFPSQFTLCAPGTWC
jgi:hypothetical protein